MARVLASLVLLCAGAASAQTVDCPPVGSQCPVIVIAGERPAATPTFTGYADPAILADPVQPGRYWLAYSYLQGKAATGSAGQPVGVPHVSTRLARSDDGGTTWRLEAVLWDSALVADPEGRSRPSYFGSETPSLTATRSGSTTTWYSVRLHYFLEPVSAYEPRYATGWTMRVARATGATPGALAQAEDTVLGVRTTARAYAADVDLNALDPALADCAMWNNPIVTAQNGRLYLVAECLVFRGRTLIRERVRMVVLSTDAGGAPRQWRWRYDGVIADAALAGALGGEQLVSAEIARAHDSTLLFIASPQSGSGAFGQGCVAMELESLDPPRVRRNAAGAPVIRARQTSPPERRSRTGACTYAAGAATGMITVGAMTDRGLRADLRATGLSP